MFRYASRRALQALAQHNWRQVSTHTQTHSLNQSHIRYLLALAGGSTGVLTGAVIWQRSMHARTVAETTDKDEVTPQEEEGEGGEETDGQVEEKKKRKGPGFRDRKIIEYENRIRQYSTPDKIFRYFATLRVVNDEGFSEIFMTPKDFVRSITPDEKQPDGLGLDQFKKIDAKRFHEIESRGSEFGMLGECGLISFADYMFLLTVLSTPEKHFEIAFRLFDLNGDGEVSYEEFQQVTEVILQQTATGQRHRDRKTTGNTLDKPFTNTSLTTYFFGRDLDRKLTTDEFSTFQRKLRESLLKMEFDRFNPEDGKITERNLGQYLLVYAELPKVRSNKMLKRVKKKFSEDEQGVTFKEFMDLQKFLRSISDVDTALSFYHVAGAAIDPGTLKHVAKMVAGVQLTDRVVDIVFTLFDENDDGRLSHKEFVSVVKHRVQRGLDKPKELGFAKIISAMWKCAKKTKPNIPYFSNDS
ncbi:calcium uptake protein 1, mitochondrial-like [Amphiura filiformis]|uniref:calcium uptake protein 1, mitochondrial-like n=1 Tax=Amphiura filiformis TaxID=82378 RepID=UPI003B2249A6